MSRIARIIFNTNNWSRPSKSDDIGILVNQPNHYHFRLEEWLFNQELKKLQIGYIDCFRANYFPQIVNKMLLVVIDPTDNCYYHIGNVFNVSQIQNNEIQEIRNQLNGEWLNSVNEIFSSQPFFDLRPIVSHEYNRNWISNDIVANAPLSFMANIRYEKIEMLKKAINLSSLDERINNRKIQRLSKLYYCDTLLKKPYNDKLKDYIREQSI